MKTLGLIGGTTWISTVDYYKYVNQLTVERSGGANSSKLLLYSVDFGEFKNFIESDDWEQIAEVLSGVAKRLEAAGADCIVLCSNTSHLVADTIQQHIGIPILHIVDATAKEILRREIKQVGLLGTKFTMEKDFFKEKLLPYGIETLIPEAADRDFIHTSIFSELGKNIFSRETKQRYLEIIERLRLRGAEGVILGCTEIPMLIKPEDCNVATFDTTLIHAKYAVDFAFS